MKYSVLLLLLSFFLAALSFLYGGVTWLPLLWLSTNFCLLGIAHLGPAHGIFGKRPDGSLSWWSWILFLPLHTLHNLVWHVFRLLATEPASSPVSGQLTIGRRLLPHENPGGFANYVDLTAEFSEPRILRELPGYIAFPILDASTPSLEQLRAVIARLQPGRTLIHCAQGHGRTGLFALAYLLSRGDVRTVEDGLSLLKKARPALHLNRAQMACVRSFAQRLSKPAGEERG